MPNIKNQKTIQRFSHPGFNKQQRPFGMKGRGLDDKAYQEVVALLESEKYFLPKINIKNGDVPRRDLLIEYLHLIQDKYHCLQKKHIKALAVVMKLAETEIYEVASFYAHFDILPDGESPPKITVRVCDSVACMMAGAHDVIKNLQKKHLPAVNIKPSPCMGHCDRSPVAEVGFSYVYGATVEKICQKIKNQDIHVDKLKAPNLKSFQKSELKGYGLLKKIRTEKKFGDEVIAILADANLRGLGGAGFPAAKKWQIVRGFQAEKLMAVNIDEGEPGTFKDYFYLAKNPHQFILGMLMAAEIVGVSKIFIYLRDEYPDIRLLLQKTLQEAEGFFGNIAIELRRGAGAYICGEESAMIESIEGKRGLPRNRPPFVAEVGIFNRPTLVNNMETLYWVPEIVMRGSDWWNGFGVNGRRGLRSFSLSGRVKKPGVKLAAAGITVKELIENYGGGMMAGHRFKGYLPGGASGGILPATMDSLPLDFDTLQEYGCFIGSAAVVVLSDKDNMADIAENLMKFFKDESCGQCTPCRVGTEKVLALIKQRKWHKDLLDELTVVMSDASICGLGQAAGNPIKSVMTHFPNDFTAM